LTEKFNDEDTSGITLKLMEVKNGQDNHCRTDENNFNDINEVTYTRVASSPFVELELKEDQELERDDEPDRVLEVLNPFGLYSPPLAASSSFRRKPESRRPDWIPHQVRNDRI